MVVYVMLVAMWWIMVKVMIMIMNTDNDDSSNNMFCMWRHMVTYQLQ